MSSPPPFENKPQCHKCGTKFNIITRQHHWSPTHPATPRHTTPHHTHDCTALGSTHHTHALTALSHLAAPCARPSCCVLLCVSAVTAVGRTAMRARRPTFHCPTTASQSRRGCATSASHTCRSTTEASRQPAGDSHCTRQHCCTAWAPLTVRWLCDGCVCSAERRRCPRRPLPRQAGCPLLLK